MKRGQAVTITKFINGYLVPNDGLIWIISLTIMRPKNSKNKPKCVGVILQKLIDTFKPDAVIPTEINFAKAIPGLQDGDLIDLNGHPNIPAPKGAAKTREIAKKIPITKIEFNKN